MTAHRFNNAWARHGQLVLALEQPSDALRGLLAGSSRNWPVAYGREPAAGDGRCLSREKCGAAPAEFALA